MTIAVNAAGSLTASSARTLRSSSMFLAFMPAINFAYVVPSWRAAALIRVIHRLRRSRFLLRRSRYAYCNERITPCFARRKLRVRLCCMPLAALRIFLCFARAVTPRLTRMGYAPIARRIFFAIEPVTFAVVLMARLRLFDFLAKKCPLNARRRVILPVLVSLMRFAVPLWVFSFGIIYSLLLRSDCGLPSEAFVLRLLLLRGDRSVC